MSEQRPRIRVGAIIPRDDTLLMVRHVKNERSYWMPPGGGVDWGEPLDEALARELREETGYEISVGPLLLAKDSIAPDGSRHIVHLLFRASVTGGAAAASTDARVKESAWVPMNRLQTEMFFPDVLPQLLAVLGASGYTGAQYVGNTWVP